MPELGVAAWERRGGTVTGSYVCVRGGWLQSCGQFQKVPLDDEGP